MIALYRSNPEAFGGNINILRRGAVLRVPGADEIAALNQKEAMGEVHRQMDAWRSAGGAEAAPSGHLRLVTPAPAAVHRPAPRAAVERHQRLYDDECRSTGAQGSGQGFGRAARGVEATDRHPQRRTQPLQHKLGMPATPPPPPAAVPPKVAAAPAPAPRLADASTTAGCVLRRAPPTPPAIAPLPPEANSTAPAPVPTPAAPPAVKKKPAAPAPAESGSWLDWVAENWWLPAALLLALLGALGLPGSGSAGKAQAPMGDLGSLLDETHVTDMRDPTAKLAAMRKGNESFVVEESGEHQAPDFNAESNRFGDTGELKSPDDTMSSESAVNLDQGDPLAEADFHMAYGLYDQAADLVRIALEREPDRRDLRLKLLEIYFVWGNKDAFLQTAKGLEATRDRAPAGEWDKIVIMGKQICPDEPLFAASAGSGRGAGALVDLNLEGGENRVDIDLFGDPEGERSSLDHSLAKRTTTPRRPANPRPARRGQASTSRWMRRSAARRIADPRNAAARRADGRIGVDEFRRFADDRVAGIEDRGNARSHLLEARRDEADQTAEVSIDDLGLDLDQLEQTGAPAPDSISNSRKPIIRPMRRPWWRASMSVHGA